MRRSLSRNYYEINYINVLTLIISVMITIHLAYDIYLYTMRLLLREICQAVSPALLFSLFCNASKVLCTFIKENIM